MAFTLLNRGPAYDATIRRETCHPVQGHRCDQQAVRYSNLAMCSVGKVCGWSQSGGHEDRTHHQTREPVCCAVDGSSTRLSRSRYWFRPSGNGQRRIRGITGRHAQPKPSPPKPPLLSAPCPPPRSEHRHPFRSNRPNRRRVSGWRHWSPDAQRPPSQRSIDHDNGATKIRGPNGRRGHGTRF